VWEGWRTNFSSTKFSHQRGELSEDKTTRDIVQQHSLLSIANGDRVVQALSRKSVGHLFGSSKSLLDLWIVATKVPDGAGSSNNGGLYILSVSDRGRDLLGSTLVCDGKPRLGKFGLELSGDGLNSKESNAKCDGDAKILVRGREEERIRVMYFSSSTCESTRS
jgi:hypothetical protein